MRTEHLQKGFTLIEMLVVAAILGIVSTFLLMNLGSSRVNLSAAGEKLIAEIRDVQFRASGNSRQGGALRCGFGITPDTNDRSAYFAYWGPDSSTTDCSAIDHNFLSGEDSTYVQQKFADWNIEFKEDIAGTIFKDVFFMPPDPRTYIDNSATLGTPPARLLFGIKGRTCTTTKECRAVCIYPSGLIQLASGLTCL